MMAAKPKPWTRDEIHRLYRYAETTTQQVAARKLGRSWKAIAGKARVLGIRWRQGTWSCNALAAEVGCSPSTVRRLVEILWPDDAPYVSTGCARRLMLPYEDGIRVIEILTKNRPHRAKKIQAGKARHGL